MRRLLIAALATLAGLAQAQTVIVRTNEIAGNVFQSENLVGLAGTWRVTLYSVDGGAPFVIAPSNAEMRVIDRADNRTVSYSVMRGAESNTLRGEAIISSRTDPTMAAIPFHLQFVRRSDQVPLYWASIRVTNAPVSGGSINITNQFAPSTTNYWDIGLTNVISVSNTISVGNTSVTNTIINTITNYVDATVTVPGLTVTVSQITVPINRLTAIGEVSGLVATTQGDGSVSWLDRAGAVDAYATTNYLARVDTIRVGAGLIGSIDGGALNIEYLGTGLPPMPPGSAITNVVAYTYGGANTGMWVQASSGVTSWYVHAVGAGGGAANIYYGGLGGTSVAMLRVTPLAWYYVEVGAAGASGYTMTNSVLTANTNAASYPGGGLGWTRGIYVGANGGGYSAIWDGAPDRATVTNLMLIAGGGGGAGRAGNGGGGGGAGAWEGDGATVGYIAAGANGTNVALAVPWKSCIVTGQSPGLLVGGDAQVLTNAQAGVNSGSGGGGGGYGGGAGGVSLSAPVRGGGGGGSGYINTAYVIAAHDRPAITIRAPLASSESVPSLSESPEYRAYGGVAGQSGQNGVVIIGEVISL